MSSASPAAVSLIVPTYNERGRLAELTAAVFEVVLQHGIDGELRGGCDNAPECTGELAEELKARYRIRVVPRPGKLGLGTAVIDGFKMASSSIVGVIDADLSHPPAVLPRMLEQVRERGADFVIGSRY